MPTPNQPSLANFTGPSEIKPEMAQLAKRMMGQTIVDVRWLTDEEMEDRMINSRAPAIVLSNGDLIVGMTDGDSTDGSPLEVTGGMLVVCD